MALSALPVKLMLKNVLWKETLWYNALRSAFCGLVVSTLTMGMPEAISPLVAPLGWVMVYFVFVPIALGFSSFFGLLGLVVTGIASLFFVTLGDPFVWLLNRFVPQAVPVERPSFFSFKAVRLVTVPEKERHYALVELPSEA